MAPLKKNNNPPSLFRPPPPIRGWRRKMDQEGNDHPKKFPDFWKIFLKGKYGIGKPPALSHHQGDVVFSGFLDHLQGLPYVQSHRLFDQDMLPGPGKGQGDGMMKMVGQGYDHRVNLRMME